jgi:hypothetical protein
VTQDEGYLEVVVEVEPGGDRAFVMRWLEEHGFATQPLVVGVLATGSAETFRRAFGADPRGRPPVPSELRGHVASVSVAPAKDWHGGT